MGNILINKQQSLIVSGDENSLPAGGRMFGDNDSGVTGRAIFSAEFSGGNTDPLIAADGFSLQICFSF